MDTLVTHTFPDAQLPLQPRMAVWEQSLHSHRELMAPLQGQITNLQHSRICNREHSQSAHGGPVASQGKAPWTPGRYYVLLMIETLH